MSEQAHSIRFKRDGVEFELTGSETDVQKAWSALESSIVGAFGRAAEQHPRAPKPDSEKQTADTGDMQTKAKRRGGRRTTGGKTDEVLDKLLNADFDTFPALPDDAQAVYTGLATLQWAKDTLGIDGLTIAQIHKFLSQKLRYSQSQNAYTNAFSRSPRSTNGTGTPKIFRLMRAGDAALGAYLKAVAAGGSEKDAEKAGAEAEQKA